MVPPPVIFLQFGISPRSLHRPHPVHTRVVTHPPAPPSPLHASPAVHAQGRRLSCPQENTRKAQVQASRVCYCTQSIGPRLASLLALHALSLSQHRLVSSPDLDAWRSKKPDRWQVYTPLEQSSPKLNSTGGMFILRSCNLPQAKPYKRFLRPGTVASAKHKTFSPCSLEFDFCNIAMFQNEPFGNFPVVVISQCFGTDQIGKKFEKKIYI